MQLEITLTKAEKRSVSNKQELIALLSQKFTNALQSMSKREIIVAVKNGTEEYSGVTEYIRRPDGQVEKEATPILDSDTDDVVKTLTVDYEYFDTGELKKHIRKITDKDGNVIHRSGLRYFKDGRQPEVIE